MNVANLITVLRFPLLVLVVLLLYSISGAALRYGYSAHSMMHFSWGRWLVASAPMRTGYGVVKAVAFTLLALALGLKTGGTWLGTASGSPARCSVGCRWRFVFCVGCR